MSDILRVKCTGHIAPDPAGGAYSIPPDPLAGFEGPTSKGGEERGGKKRWGRGSEGRGLSPGSLRGIEATDCKTAKMRAKLPFQLTLKAPRS